MTHISIRSLQGEDFLDVLYNPGMYAFHASPPFQDKEEWAKIVRECKGVTYHVLFEDGIQWRQPISRVVPMQDAISSTCHWISRARPTASGLHGWSEQIQFA